jgi:vancomycin resistance protein YoaR
LDDQQLLSFLALPQGIDQEKIQAYIDELKTKINRPSSDAHFSYDPETLQVTEFIPDQDGLEIDSEASKNIINNFISTILDSESATILQENTFTLPMANAKATITWQTPMI